jgi:hypothetical protein
MGAATASAVLESEGRIKILSLIVKSAGSDGDAAKAPGQK